MLRYWKTVLRSGVIGVYVGILPGVGEDMAAWSSYAAAKRASKEKEQFGKGSVEGLMAAETGDNASIPGAIIPALALAIPGSAPAAVLLAAMIIHGVRPGPMLMVEQPQFVYDVVAMCILATLGILFFGLFAHAAAGASCACRAPSSCRSSSCCARSAPIDLAALCSTSG